MIYFHFCETFLSQIDINIKNQIWSTLYTYSNRNSLKGVGKITNFTGGIYLLNLKNPYSEIILQEQKIKHDGIEYLVYFIRGYKNKLSDYVEIRDGKWLFYNQLAQSDIELFKEEIKKTNILKIAKQSPPYNLYKWQDTYKLRVEYDIYEAESWVKFAMNNSKIDGMKTDEVKLYQICLENIISKDITNLKTTLLAHDDYKVKSIIIHNIGVIYSEFIFNEKTYFLLCCGSNIKSQKEAWDSLQKKDYSYLNSVKTIKDLASLAIKAYPSWAVKDADLWTKIEKNNEIGNLSLLPEQTEFLKEFKFPKYINGQAGSGKSTMLYYLFANAYYFKYANEIEGEIIFLTENEKLLDHTVQSVLDLLINNPEFDLTSEITAITNVKKHFIAFKDFLLNKLPPNQTDFEANKYINFSKFKILYLASKLPIHVKKKFSAEFVWFTLSTYMYGYILDKIITAETYDELMPKEGKEIINKTDFKTIESEIIKPFYEKLLLDGYWDKPKLINYIYKNRINSTQYQVIFCDEAQDFNKIELEYIFNQSIYINYKLNNVPQFPIVFAGDANQTVNPTGFRSEILTSMIYTALANKATAFKFDPKNLEFSPSYNYRSSQKIVNLANSIQYFRKQYLEANIASPQISKRPVSFDNEHLNIYILSNEISGDANLIEKIQLKTIIVPVNTDEIIDYKLENSDLQQFNNIISSVDAKGIDFNEVVVYGFGDYYINKISGEYEKRYFFNKLYVAVTRAQSELLIIDSKKAKDSFWLPMIEDFLQSPWNNSPKNIKCKIDDLVIFSKNEVILSPKNIHKHDAKRQLERGIIEKNISLLKIASSHFIKLGDKAAYYECLGEIELVNENFKKAAELFLRKEMDSKGIEKALNAYWQGNYFEEIISTLQNPKSTEQHVLLMLTKAFLDKEFTEPQLILLKANFFYINKLLLTPEHINHLMFCLESTLNKTTDPNTLLSIYELLDLLVVSDNNILESLAIKFYNLDRFEIALQLIERVSSKNKLYLQCKLEIARRKNDVKDIILYAGRIISETKEQDTNLPNLIIETYEANFQTLVNSNDKYILLYIYFSILLINPTHESAIDLAQKTELIFRTDNRIESLIDRYVYLNSNFKLNKLISEFINERISKLYKNLNTPLESINENLKKLFPPNRNFINFTEDEIQNIPLNPSYIFKPLPEHFENFFIHNFKSFNNVNINDLGLINIIVGDNNIGKTSLLEALLFTSKKEILLQRLAFAYIERTNILPQIEYVENKLEVKYLIKENFVLEYFNKLTSIEAFDITINNKRNTWKYRVSVDSKSEFNSENLIFSEQDFTILKKLDFLDSINTPLISYGKGYGLDLAQIYEKHIRIDRRKEKSIINNLKLFIPSIEQIFTNSEGGIEIRDAQFQTDQPLTSYGEGANKLFRIILILTMNANKRVMIDEIDAGIHHTRFVEFWSIVLNIAQENNIQLFATTHNKECIKYFIDTLKSESVNTNLKNDCRILQMKNVKGVKIHCYNYDSFNLAYQHEIELRGGDY